MHKYPQNNRKLRPPLGELGMHFEANLWVLGSLRGVLGSLVASWGVVWADSCSQARLGRRPGRLVGDFGGLDGPNLGPKMASSWGLDRTKIDANIARIFDAFEN